MPAVLPKDATGHRPTTGHGHLPPSCRLRSRWTARHRGGARAPIVPTSINPRARWLGPARVHRRSPRTASTPGSGQIVFSRLDGTEEDRPMSRSEDQRGLRRRLAVPDSDAGSQTGDLDAIAGTVASGTLTPCGTGESGIVHPHPPYIRHFPTLCTSLIPSTRFGTFKTGPGGAIFTRTAEALAARASPPREHCGTRGTLTLR